MDAAELTADAIRQHLVTRAEAFAAARGCSLSKIGEEAISDSKFLANVKGGANFTVKTYQRVIDWLDAEEATTPAEAAA